MSKSVSANEKKKGGVIAYRRCYKKVEVESSSGLAGLRMVVVILLEGSDNIRVVIKFSRSYLDCVAGTTR